MLDGTYVVEGLLGLSHHDRKLTSPDKYQRLRSIDLVRSIVRV